MTDEEEVPGLDDDEEEIDEIVEKRDEQIGLMMVEVARVSRHYPGMLHKHTRSQRVPWKEREAQEEEITRLLLNPGFIVEDVTHVGFCVWHALARTVGMDQKLLWEKVLQDMDARRHLYATFVLGSYMELLNGLRNPNGWTT